MQFPRVSHVFVRAGVVYKLVLIKNVFAVSDKVIRMGINDQSHSLTCLISTSLKKMFYDYSYTCLLNQCYTCDYL